MPDFTTALLAEDMGRFSTDPLGFVLYAFPWGQGELIDYPDGPDEFARHVLDEIGQRLRAGEDVGAALREVVRVAVASGHGIGKSALMAWLVLWTLSTMEDALGVVTANTEQQLRTKTWPQVVKWYNLCITRQWFTLTDTAIYRADPLREKTWRFDRVTWSEHNTEAFAGLHNAGKRVVLLFDEASKIADKVWEVSEGALTDENTQIIWCVFGNPTLGKGRFFECFHRFRHRWFCLQVDSRTVRITNKRQIQQWIDDWGLDSDFVKVRVLGQFPSRSGSQLISIKAVEEAERREAVSLVSDPLIIGVDVARFGDDASVIARRRGRDAQTYPLVKLHGADGILVAQHVMRLYKEHEGRGEHVDAIFVDATGGWGGSPVDHLRYMGYDVIEVMFGAESPDPDFANMRCYMWAQLAQWMKTGALVQDQQLRDDLTLQEYTYRGDKMILVSKEAMKAEGLASPDCGDAMALTFAYPVVSKSIERKLALENLEQHRLERKRGARQAPAWDYDPLGDA